LSFVPLTRSEEKELFRRFYHENDTRARDEIIKRHLKFVAKLSLTYAKGAIPDDDAISAGNFGLLQALESKCFDPERGFLFSSYLRSYVRGQVLAALRESGWKSQLLDEKERNAFAPEATVTGSHCDDTKRFRHGGFTVAYRARKCHGDGVDNGVEGKQLNEVRRDAITKALKQLPKLEAETVQSHFFKDKNFADIGRAHNLTREGIRKAFNRGMTKLKDILASREEELA
jgi:RNA polymerase sigma factor (sigma-70 family)